MVPCLALHPSLPLLAHLIQRIVSLHGCTAVRVYGGFCTGYYFVNPSTTK